MQSESPGLHHASIYKHTQVLKERRARNTYSDGRRDTETRRGSRAYGPHNDLHLLLKLLFTIVDVLLRNGHQLLLLHNLIHNISTTTATTTILFWVSVDRHQIHRHRRPYSCSRVRSRALVLGGSVKLSEVRREAMDRV